MSLILMPYFCDVLVGIFCSYTLQIAPVTTETVLNQQTCLQVNGSNEQNVQIQSVLPDMTDFKYIGKVLLNCKW